MTVRTYETEWFTNGSARSCHRPAHGGAGHTLSSRITARRSEPLPRIAVTFLMVARLRPTWR